MKALALCFKQYLYPRCAKNKMFRRGKKFSRVKRDATVKHRTAFAQLNVNILGYSEVTSSSFFSDASAASLAALFLLNRQARTPFNAPATSTRPANSRNSQA